MSADKWIETTEPSRVELPGPCPKCGYCFGVMVADLDPRRTDKAMKLKCGRCRFVVATDVTPIEEEA